MTSAFRRLSVEPLPLTLTASGLPKAHRTPRLGWSLAIAGLVLALAGGPATAGRTDSQSNTGNARPSPSSAPRQSFGSFGSSPAKRESAAAPSRSAPAAAPARSDDRRSGSTSFGSFGSARAQRDAAAPARSAGRSASTTQAAEQPERKPPATRFGSFGNSSQRTDAKPSAPAAPPLQAARPNNSMANDLSSTTARNQAMRSFDDRQQQPSQQSPQAARAQAQAAEAIANARQSSGATSAALVQQRQPAPAGMAFGGTPAGVNGTAAYERGRRIQAERLADQRQRELDEANARAYRAQMQQRQPVDDRPLRPSAPRNGMGLGTGVGLAAGAVAGAALATAATAGATPSDKPGADMGGATAGPAIASPGGSAFQDAAPRVPPAKAPDSGLGSAWLFIVLGALVIGLYIRAKRLKAQAQAQTRRYAL